MYVDPFALAFCAAATLYGGYAIGRWHADLQHRALLDAIMRGIRHLIDLNTRDFRAHVEARPQDFPSDAL